MALPARVKHRRGRPARRPAEREAIVPTAVKVALIDRLTDAGLPRDRGGELRVAQVGAADGRRRRGLGAASSARPASRYPVLVPNSRASSRALAAGADEVAVFGAASESVLAAEHQLLDRRDPRALPPGARSGARPHGVRVRGYVVCVLGCPYEGEVAGRGSGARRRRRCIELGCYEVSLGDTIGVGTPGKARRMIERCAEAVPMAALAGHFHDTYGQALANIYACLEAGVRRSTPRSPASAAAPMRKGATGNVATEDVVYMLHGLGIETGVDLKALAATGAWISQKLNRPNGSRSGSALAAT